MKYLFLISFLLMFLAGCGEHIPVPPKQEIIKTKCPKFNTKLRIKIEDLNSTHGAISWGDVSKIEYFIKSKKKFNNSIDSINIL